MVFVVDCQICRLTDVGSIDEAEEIKDEDCRDDHEVDLST
jgi:hypothetical protein